MSVLFAIIALMWLPVAIGSLTYTFGDANKPFGQATRYLAIGQGLLSTIVLSGIILIVAHKTFNQRSTIILILFLVIVFVTVSFWFIYLLAMVESP